MARMTMPDPARQVRHSVRLLRWAGLTEQQALDIVITTCDTVISRHYGTVGVSWEWIYQIQANAKTRRSKLATPSPQPGRQAHERAR